MCGAVGQSALMATRTLYAKTNTQAQTILVIVIYPSTGLRVVSLSNHLEFGICVLEFPVYPD
jgi:hypothetical protein